MAFQTHYDPRQWVSLGSNALSLILPLETNPIWTVAGCYVGTGFPFKLQLQEAKV